MLHNTNSSSYILITYLKITFHLNMSFKNVEINPYKVADLENLFYSLTNE